MQSGWLKRRNFITLLGGAASWPLAARAQQIGRTYRLGFLNPVGKQAPAVLAFFDELRINGFVEGENLGVIEDGFDVTKDHISELAASLVKAAPDAIVAGPEPQLRALQQLTSRMPIIGMSEDMVAEALVQSLSHPGSN